MTSVPTAEARQTGQSPLFSKEGVRGSSKCPHMRQRMPVHADEPERPFCRLLASHCPWPDHDPAPCPFNPDEEDR